MVRKRKAPPKKKAAPKKKTRSAAKRAAPKTTNGVRAKPKRPARPAKKPKGSDTPPVAPEAKDSLRPALVAKAKVMPYAELLRSLELAVLPRDAAWREVLKAEITERRKTPVVIRRQPAGQTKPARAKDEEE